MGNCISRNRSRISPFPRPTERASNSSSSSFHGTTVVKVEKNEPGTTDSTSFTVGSTVIDRESDASNFQTGQSKLTEVVAPKNNKEATPTNPDETAGDQESTVPSVTTTVLKIGDEPDNQASAKELNKEISSSLTFEETKQKVEKKHSCVESQASNDNSAAVLSSSSTTVEGPGTTVEGPGHDPVVTTQDGGSADPINTVTVDSKESSGADNEKIQSVDTEQLLATRQSCALDSIPIIVPSEKSTETKTHDPDSIHTFNDQVKHDDKSIRTGTSKHSVILVKPLEKQDSDDLDEQSTEGGNKLLDQEQDSLPLRDGISPTESVSEHLEEESDNESMLQMLEQFATTSNGDAGSHHSTPDTESNQPISEVQYDFHKSVYDRLVARKSEKPIRDKVADVLKTWEISGKLEELEISVRNIESSCTGTIEDLAEALKKDYDNDSSVGQIALAYKVYYWVTNNICYSRSAHGVSDPKKVLQTGKAECLGYSTLFQAICREVGLEVNRVNGHARSLQKSKWNLDDSGHTWNMVKIEKTCFQVDCTHGSGTYQNGKFEQEFTRVYFFPAPEKLILTHWVEDEMLQLLEHQVSFNDIQQLVVLNQKTLSMGILPETIAQCITLPSNSSQTTKIEINTTRNDIEISAVLDLSKEINDQVCTTDPDSANNGHVNNNNNSLTLVQKTAEDKVTVNVAVPKKGTFPLEIYSAEKCSNNNTSMLCLLYNLTNDHEVTESEFIGYPKVYKKAASNSDFHLLMEDTPNAHVCKTENKVEMKFKLKQNVKLRHSICEGKVEKQTEKRLKCYTHLVRDKSNTNICHLTTLFPKPGWWTVFLLVTSDLESDHYLMQYQVYATSECKNVLYPHVTRNAAEVLGITLEDEHTPIRSCDSNQTIQLKFTALAGLEYIAELVCVDESGKKKDDQTSKHCACIIPPHEGTCAGQVYAIVPPGTWCLDVYANEPQFHKLKHIICAEMLYGSEALKQKVVPNIHLNFSKMSLFPPPNIKDWVLPEEVVYPKTIEIPFVQVPNSEMQLYCYVEHEDKKVSQTHDKAKLKELSSNCCCDDVQFCDAPHKHRILEVVVLERGKWTFALMGRKLQEYNSVITLMEYTVIGL